VAAILASYTTKIEELTFISFVQGIGAASRRIIGVAIVRYLYDKERAVVLLSNICTMSSMMPILSLFIGSELVHSIPFHYFSHL